MSLSLRRSHLLWLLVLALVAGLTAMLSPTPPARAFKPFTHVVTAWSAYGDAVDDGSVTIEGRSYPVDGRVVEALRDWPSYYQAGVIGPDGFPDLTYGQSVIHPDRTGEWVRHVLQRAWAFQKLPVVPEAQKEQVLAFAYGFATHAAGDVWAHTLVNDLSGGVFPGVKEMAGRPAKIAIALRHIIVEGYVGDATPGFDGNPDRTQVGSDVSDDASTPIALDAPHAFIYDTFVDPRRSLPVGNSRGPLVDFFLDLESDLQIRSALERRDEKHTDCFDISPGCSPEKVTITVDTVRGKRSGHVTLLVCNKNIFCKNNEAEALKDVTITRWVRQYLDAWVDDIERGLRHWSELGLAVSRGLFDPQARRNLQNLECAKYGAESEPAREVCESDITAKDVVLHEAEPFINDHLLSMLGLPDATGKVLKALGSISDFLDKIVGPALNPLKQGKAALKKRADKLINDTVRDVFGVDLEMISSFLEHPSYWMNVDKVSVSTPAGRLSIPLFAPGTRDRLDALMGLTPADHRSISITLPDGQVVTESVLADSAVARSFAVMDNATTLSKLLLLDGERLGRLSTDVLQGQGVLRPGVPVRTYPFGATVNVMTHGLIDGVADSVAPWLRSADGGHNWRQGGGGDGGYGRFPLWESCLLRPVFRTVFDDWEHGGEVFPDLGDEAAYDATDPKPPKLTVKVLSPNVLRLDPFRPANSALFVGAGPGLEAVATDEVFTDAAVSLKWRRTWTGDGEGGITQGTGTGGTLLIPAGGVEGRYSVRVQAFDPCHQGGFGRTTTKSYRLDLTGPSVTVTTPDPGTVVDSDDLVRIRWDADDGNGVGADTADGTAHLGVDTAGWGEQLDMFLLLPGPQTIDVLQPDLLDNFGSGETSVEVHATSESLRSNVERGRRQQMIPDEGLYLHLAEQLDAAVSSHASGDHAAEEDALAQVAAVLGQQPQGIDPTLRDVLQALVEDLIALH